MSPLDEALTADQAPAPEEDTDLEESAAAEALLDGDPPAEALSVLGLEEEPLQLIDSQPAEHAWEQRVRPVSQEQLQKVEDQLRSLSLSAPPAAHPPVH